MENWLINGTLAYNGLVSMKKEQISLFSVDEKRADTYLRPCETSMMELMARLKAVNYFRKKVIDV